MSSWKRAIGSPPVGSTSSSPSLLPRASGSDSNERGVVAEQLVEPGPDVGEAQHGVVGELVEADPEAEVVAVHRPVRGEGLDVGRDHQHVVGRRAGDGQVEQAEVAGGEVAHQRPGGHARAAWG